MGPETYSHSGVFAATIRTAHKISASSFLRREKNLLGANTYFALCSQLCLAGMLTTSASPSPTIPHVCISPKEHHSLSQAQAATVYSLVSSLISQLCQLSRGEITMAPLPEGVFGQCFSRFLYSRAQNYQNLLKASNFLQKTLRSTKEVVPYLDR